MPVSKKDQLGLTSPEAQKRLERYGTNALRKSKKSSDLKLLLAQFKSPLVYILVFASLVTFFLQDYTDALVIAAAVFLNTLLGFYQERKAQKAMEALQNMLVPHAKVIRDGKTQRVEASSLVPGDLVILTLGNRVPADGLLIEAVDFSLNEAILTGESLPVGKTAFKNFGKTKRKKGYPEESLALMGTTVESGLAKMVVLKTGNLTRMGQIGRTVEMLEEEATPLQIQLGRLAKALALIVGGVTVLIFLLGDYLGYEPLEMFTTSVAVAVAAIPEGLAVTLTVILALGMQRILKQKAVVRKLLAAETLGSVSLIAADKTGTLTEGKMKVVKALFADGRVSTKRKLIKAAVLCNDLRDPLEVAMLDWAKKNPQALGHQTFAGLEKDYPRLDEIPFSPDYKYIATLHRDLFAKKGNLLFLSGAPEVVLEKSHLTKGERKKWQEEFENLGKKGYRLVGFAARSLPSKARRLRKKDLKDFLWLGFLVYEDPIRPSVKAAFKECRRAGIKIKVITGDYAPTALAVLNKLGFFTRQGKKLKTQAVMTGEELAKISPGELKKKADQVVLFARTTPEQKLKIVQAFKENGEVVAMTGDGVNDAPALAKADIGLVVGEASDVAKETADLVLLDSNFSTIVAAVREGRTIFENIKKVVLYLLSDSFTEVILITGSMFLGLPLPVTAAQILWVNLVEDALPGMALAFEPGEKDLMREPPRPRGRPILDLQLKVMIFIIGIFTDLFLLALFYWLLKGFLHLHHLQTVMFVALGINSLFYIYACRSLRHPFFRYPLFGNRFLNLSVLFGLLMLLLAVYFPPLQTFLRTQPLDLNEWLLLLGIGIFNFLAIEIGKWVFITQQEKVKIGF